MYYGQGKMVGYDMRDFGIIISYKNYVLKSIHHAFQKHKRCGSFPIIEEHERYESFPMIEEHERYGSSPAIMYSLRFYF